MNIRPFQIFLLGGFAILAVVAIIMLSTFQSSTSSEQLAYGSSVSIWGPFPEDEMDRLFMNITQEDKAFSVVSYTYVPPEQFEDRFLNAIAEGRSPDMVILASDTLVQHRAKLIPIPYDTLPIRTFRDTYVDGAEIFALNDGVYAVPFAVDPLVMYWNRDLFASNGIAQAPTTWEDVVGNVVPRTSIADQSRGIVQSGVSFGEFRNVYRAKDILLMLALQSGSGGTTENDRGYVVNLNVSSADTTRAPLEAALQFYTDFSNANSALYSWNRAQPMDTQAFIAGDLALYFGRASEVEGINSKNPNLNFDVAPIPQGGVATARRGFGTFYGFAIPRASSNVSGAYAAAQRISGAKYADELTLVLNMAPVRRDLIAAGSSNPFRAITLQSALVARGWLDPDAEASAGTFQTMVEDVVSNRARVSAAVNDAISRLVLEY